MILLLRRSRRQTPCTLAHVSSLRSMASSFCALILLSFSRSIFASPIPPSSSSDQAHPAALVFAVLGVLLVIAALAIIKCIYINSRRVRATQVASLSSSGYYEPFSIDSYCRSSLSLNLGSQSSSKASLTEKSGFFIGLLGSPAWETKIQAGVYTAARRQRQDSSVVYQHSTPPLPLSPKPIRSKQDILHSNSLSESRDKYCRPARLLRASSLKLPGGLEKEKALDLRRVLFPFLSQERKRTLSFELSDVDAAIKQRRASSGGTMKRISTRQPKACEKGWQNEASLQLTDAPNRSRVSLSSFRVTSDSSSPFRSNPLSPVCRIKSSPRSSTNFTLQSTVTGVPLSSATNASSSNVLLSPAPVISRPYPLSVNKKSVAAPDLKLLPKDGMYTSSRDSRLYLEILPVLKPLDICTEPSEPSLDTPPVTGLNIDLAMDNNISVRKLSSLEISPPLHSVSPSTLPLNSKLVISPLVKIKNTHARKKVPIRPQRPPSVGPSPLRTMIIPNASSTSDTSSIGSTKKKNTSNTKIFSKSHRVLRSLPSTTNVISNVYRPHSSEYDEFGAFSRKPYFEVPVQTRRTSQDSEVLQASTNAKHASLIMSNMIRTSTLSKSPSKQVDLGLIGLDRFRLRDEDGRFVGVEGKSGKVDDNEIDFVSFWEEAKLLEEDDRRYVSSSDWIYFKFLIWS